MWFLSKNPSQKKLSNLIILSRNITSKNKGNKVDNIIWRVIDERKVNESYSKINIKEHESAYGRGIVRNSIFNFISSQKATRDGTNKD